MIDYDITNGTENMTLDEINIEIDSTRKEKRAVLLNIARLITHWRHYFIIMKTDGETDGQRNCCIPITRSD